MARREWAEKKAIEKYGNKGWHLPYVKPIFILLGLVALSGCTTPCPPMPERYTCPDDLGTTWGAEDANGCARYVCSVGGRGGFVEAP